MDLSQEILSQVTVYSKYARYLPDEKRRETWDEIVTRNVLMHIKKYPDLAEEIGKNYQLVYDKKVLPSMRGLQFGGKPVEISPNRQYNCCFCPIDDWYSFPEVMFLLLGGSGVGFSVQKHHIDKLPHIQKPIDRNRRHLIGDSIEGWAEAIKVLMKSYFFGLSNPIFDFSDIRPKGAPLKTSGGRAPGPQPLKDCIHHITGILDAKEPGSKLTPLEVHDIICFIADAVLSGGIRRSALISLFSFDDEQMLTCKYGNFWEENPQRSRANNSAVVLRHRIKRKEFKEFWKKVKINGTGEPGIYFSNNAEYGTNPCVEIGLRANQFCNLTTVNASTITSQEDLEERVQVAAFIGTLQAGYTDFHYLRDIWQNNTEKDALIGVSMTGIASAAVLDLDLEAAAQVVVEENIRVAEFIGINSAARTTCIKPEGTASCVLGTSSGIHAWHDEYYIRRQTFNKEEPIYGYIKNHLSELVEDAFGKPHLEAKLSVPQKAPKGAILRDEGPIATLERVKKFSEEWVQIGHIRGDNSHNVSATIYAKEEEWDEVGDWMWLNRHSYNGLAVFPYSGGNYPQMPFESCTKYMYEKMMSQLVRIDLTQVIEEEDNTSLKESVACAGAGCEIS